MQLSIHVSCVHQPVFLCQLGLGFSLSIIIITYQYVRMYVHALLILSLETIVGVGKHVRVCTIQVQYGHRGNALMVDSVGIGTYGY